MPLLTPTLGGLKDLQTYFEYYGIDLPTFVTDVCQNRPDEPGKVHSLDTYLQWYGRDHPVTNVRLCKKNGNEYEWYIEFTDVKDCHHCGHAATMDDLGVIIHLYHGNNQKFGHFVQTNGPRILRIAKDGRPAFSLGTRFGMWCRGV